MAKRTETQVQKVDGIQDLLKYDADDSLLKLQEYVVVPFIKLIQGMTEQELKEKFGEGSVVLRPGDVKIIDKDGKFLFVPLFFFTSFRQWADRKDTIMIVETSYDPDSSIAKFSRDPDKRSQAYEEDKDKEPKNQRCYRFVEHLCFIGLIYDGELAGTRCLISFQKGDFRVGRAFASGAQMRKVDIDGTRQQVPLWAQVWEIGVSLRDRNENKWWGFDPGNPPEGIEPIISPDEYESHHTAYEELSKAHAANMIRVDGDDSDPDETSIKDSKDF